MSLAILNAQLRADVSPAKAGTPNLGIAPRGVQHGVPALAGAAEIQQWMKELDAAMRETSEQLETQSHKQAAAAVATDRWIAGLATDRPVDEALIRACF